ncbi:hypothetical protein LXL04_022976 [Taraxacum kok-saghyz]
MTITMSKKKSASRFTNKMINPVNVEDDDFVNPVPELIVVLDCFFISNKIFIFLDINIFMNCWDLLRTHIFPRTPPISYISQTVIPFKKPTSEPSKTLKFERFLAPRSRFFEKVNGLGVLGTIIGFENERTNLGHLFHFASHQFSVAGALPPAQHI